MSRPVERSVFVRCPIERAFETFTRRLDEWWPSSHRKLGGALTLEGFVGGRFVETKDDEEAVLGHVVRWEPPHRVTYTWVPGSNLGPTEVDVRFLVQENGTRVEVRHAEGASGLGDEWPVRVRRFEAAWDQVLPAFERLVEGSGDDE